MKAFDCDVHTWMTLSSQPLVVVVVVVVVGWTIDHSLHSEASWRKKRSASVVDQPLLLIPNATDASSTLLLARRP